MSELKRMYQARLQLLRRHGFHSYADYLASDWHAHIRRYVMARDRNTCRICGGPAWQAHHLEYTEATLFSKPRGPNQLANVVTLCATCHEATHYQDDGSPASDIKQRTEELMGLARPESRKAKKPKRSARRARKGKRKAKAVAAAASRKFKESKPKPRARK